VYKVNEVHRIMGCTVYAKLVLNGSPSSIHPIHTPCTHHTHAHTHGMRAYLRVAPEAVVFALNGVAVRDQTFDSVGSMALMHGLGLRLGLGFTITVISMALVHELGLGLGSGLGLWSDRVDDDESAVEYQNGNDDQDDAHRQYPHHQDEKNRQK